MDNFFKSIPRSYSAIILFKQDDSEIKINFDAFKQEKNNDSIILTTLNLYDLKNVFK